MNATELQYLIMDLLHEHFQKEDPPKTFCGVQGDNLVVMQSGGEHLGIVIVPAKATVPG